MRELAARRSGSRGQRSSRQKDRRRREVLSGCGQRFHTGRSHQARHVADPARRWSSASASELRSLHRTGHGSARSRRSRNLSDESQLQRPHGLARRAVLSGQPSRSSQRRRLPATSAGRRKLRRNRSRRTSSSSPPLLPRPRKSRFFPASHPAFADAWSSCRRTT